MNRTLIATVGLALLAVSGVASASSWSVVVQPGVYGRVAIGGYAEAPQVYAPQPVVAIDDGYGQVVEETVDPAYASDQPPVYLWVPEYQRTHWAEYCREYGAYGVPVYFVDDRWYQDNVMRRNWTAEQRSWNQQQWLQQDRIARDHFEHQRFEQQRYEQQARDHQRWNSERSWHEQQRPQPQQQQLQQQQLQRQQPQQQQPQQQPQQQRGFDQQRGQQASWPNERAPQYQGNRMGWGTGPGVVSQQQQTVIPAPRGQQGGQWQAPGNGGGRASDGGGRPGQQPGQGAASQARGGERAGTVQDVSERHGDSRGQGDARGAYEHGRDGNRDR